MPQNALLTRSVAVVLSLMILAAMPRQADATDDPGNVSFDERWQAVPYNGEFICGFKPEVEDSSLGKSETPYVTKPPFIPLPRGLGRHRRAAVHLH
jgi:hypothetical protein